MKIVADQNILALDKWRAKDIELVMKSGRDIVSADLRDADALLVRSITTVNAELLAGSRVRFVGTATSGTNHIDIDWLTSNNIHLADAAGANAGAVTDYVLACLAEQIRGAGFDPWAASIAIVGVGHVGGLLARRLKALGISCVGCDPFQQNVDGLEYVSFEQALQADVVCLHTPLTNEGPHATRSMMNAEAFSKMRPDAILINAGRGEVVDDEALLTHLTKQRHFVAILDVWHNEPNPSRDVVNAASLATPHIAGYSVEAKLAATQCILKALVNHFDLTASLASVSRLPCVVHDSRYETAAGSGRQPGQGSDSAVFADYLLRAFSPARVAATFRLQYNKASHDEGAIVFDRLRSQLVGRREFSASHVHAAGLSPQVAGWLHAAGFVLQA